MKLLTRGTTIVLAFALVLAVGSIGFAQAKTYWFESYQKAVDLVDDDRAAEALPLLEALIVDNPVPQIAVRVPGSQFIDYLPHFQSARAHAQLGNFEAASRSLAESESYGTVNEARRHVTDLTTLQTVVSRSSHAQLAPGQD